MVRSQQTFDCKVSIDLEILVFIAFSANFESALDAAKMQVELPKEQSVSTSSCHSRAVLSPKSDARELATILVQLN